MSSSSPFSSSSLDVSSFSSVDFDARRWLNETVEEMMENTQNKAGASAGSSHSTDPPVLRCLNDLLSSLQRVMLESDARADRLSDALHAAVPAANKHIEQIQIITDNIRGRLTTVSHDLSSLEQRFPAAAISQLSSLARAVNEARAIKRRAEIGEAWRRQAKNLEKLIEKRQFDMMIFDYRALSSLAQHEHAEAADSERTEQMKAFQQQIEAIAGPALIDGFSIVDPAKAANPDDPCQSSVSELCALVRLFEEFRQFAAVHAAFKHAAHRRIKMAIEEFAPEKAGPGRVQSVKRFHQWLSSLYSRLVDLFSAEVSFIGRLMAADEHAENEEKASLLTELLTIYSNELSQLLVEYISSHVESRPHDTATALTGLHQDTLAFLYRLYGVAHKIQQTHFHTLIAAVHRPFQALYPKYVSYESKQLVHSFATAGLQSFKQLTAHPQHFMDKLIMDACDRCLSFTGSLCWPGFVQACELFLEDFLRVVRVWLNQMKVKQIELIKKTVAQQRKPNGQRGMAMAASSSSLDLEAELSSDSFDSGDPASAMDSMGAVDEQIHSLFTALNTLRNLEKEIFHTVDNKCITALCKGASLLIDEFEAESDELHIAHAHGHGHSSPSPHKAASPTRSHLLNHPVFTSQEAFNVKLIFLPLIRDDSQRRQLLEALVVKHEKNPTSFHLFSASRQLFGAFIGEFQLFLYESMFSPIFSRLRAYSSRPSWSSSTGAAASLLHLPIFSQQPSEPINELCDYIMTLVSVLQKEPYLNGEGGESDEDRELNYWIDRVCAGVCRLMVEQVAAMAALSDKGAKQLETDLERIKPVIEALGGQIDEKLLLIMSVCRYSIDELSAQGPSLVASAATPEAAKALELFIKARKASEEKPRQG